VSGPEDGNPDQHGIPGPGEGQDPGEQPSDHPGQGPDEHAGDHPNEHASDHRPTGRPDDTDQAAEDNPSGRAGGRQAR
jgi:hypothetical protein